MKGKNAMVTIYDVAAHAGVSPKTVSRVLNQETTVRPKTRLMVEQAIQELGYIPSSAARIMRSNRSGIIGLITGAISRSTDNLRAHGLPDMFLVQGAQQAVVQSGKTLMIADTDNRLDNVEPLINTFMAHRAEGILYVAEKHQEVVLPACPINCPVVLLNCFDQVGTPAILPDDYYGQYELVKRIIAAGHQRIAYLTLPQHVVATPLRVAGYRQALKAILMTTTAVKPCCKPLSKCWQHSRAQRCCVVVMMKWPCAYMACYARANCVFQKIFRWRDMIIIAPSQKHCFHRSPAWNCPTQKWANKR